MNLINVTQYLPLSMKIAHLLATQQLASITLKILFSYHKGQITTAANKIQFKNYFLLAYLSSTKILLFSLSDVAHSITYLFLFTYLCVYSHKCEQFSAYNHTQQILKYHRKSSSSNLIFHFSRSFDKGALNIYTIITYSTKSYKLFLYYYVFLNKKINIILISFAMRIVHTTAKKC